MSGIRGTDIFCLESMWSEQLDHPRQSVLPMLQMIKDEHNINFAHFNCNTKDELIYNLSLVNRKYGIIYLAFHGEPGRILLPTCKLEIEEILENMERGFRKTVIHFASCNTFNTDKTRLSSFLDSTGASMISGYLREVFWLQTATVDLVYLDSLLTFPNSPKKAVNNLYKYISPSYKHIGFDYMLKEKNANTKTK